MRDVRLKCVWREGSLGCLPGSGVAGSSRLGILTCAHLCALQNIMPLSAAMFLSEDWVYIAAWLFSFLTLPLMLDAVKKEVAG